MLLYFRMLRAPPPIACLSRSSSILRSSFYPATSRVEFWAVQHKSWIVWVRGGNRERPSTESTGNSGQSEQSSSQSDAAPPPPSRASKLKLFLVASSLAMLSTSILFSILVNNKISDTSIIHPGTPSVDMAAFAQKYLSAGEVKNIIFFIGGKRGLATLHDGAIIDGKSTPMQLVLIKFDGTPQEFLAEVRKEEGKLEIGLDQAIPIEFIKPTSGLNLLAFSLGVVILSFLATQNGRLILKRLNEEAAKKRKTP